MKKIVKSNAKRGASSREWATAYVETNIMIREINQYISDELSKNGVRSAVVPATKFFDEKRLISNWSHRHVAYIAGLGKFGLNRMLITEMGCAGRIGSFVTDAEIPPTKRSDGEFCLYKSDLSCKKCVEKCTFGALSTDSFDRHRCYEMCLENAEKYQGYVEIADVCGKCLALVPCSFKNPVG
jgi:epoxyqueuosine reductase QueG